MLWEVEVKTVEVKRVGAKEEPAGTLICKIKFEYNLDIRAAEACVVQKHPLRVVAAKKALLLKKGLSSI